MKKERLDCQICGELIGKALPTLNITHAFCNNCAPLGTTIGLAKKVLEIEKRLNEAIKETIPSIT